MRYSGEHIDDAVFLLKELVKIPSYTFQEEAIADFLEKYLTEAEEKYACNYKIRRIKNNLLLYGDDYSQKKETLLFCAHIDTVKESGEYTFAPFCGTVANGRVLGLGSNDDKGSVTVAIFAFLYYIRYCNKKNINVILALCAEEERGGENGISLLLEKFPEFGLKASYAIICEPTGLEAAIAERGLLVVDATATGISGHAARNEGVNAIYIALDDIAKLRSYKFGKVSPVTGEVKLSVTQINAGTVHNVIPDRCSFVVDIRPTEQYTNPEILGLLQSECRSTLKARNLTNRSSATASGSPLTECAAMLGVETFVSPTTSDWMRIGCDAIKMGPGDSARSHRKDEYVTVAEIRDGIEKYITFMDCLSDLTGQTAPGNPQTPHKDFRKRHVVPYR